MEARTSLIIKITLAVLGLLGLHFPHECEAVITTIPNTVADEVLTVCPGTAVTLTCSYNASDATGNTRWEITLDSDLCAPVLPHDGPSTRQCHNGLFTVGMASFTDSMRVSTAQATATMMLDSSVVVCREGGLTADPVGGNVTIRVYDPTAAVDGVLYFVDTPLTGGISLTISSPRAYGTGIEYEGSVTGGSVVVTGGSVNVTGLNYTQNHSISITANSTVCSEVSTMAFPISLITETLSVSEPITTVTCSDPSLPIQLSWTVDTGVQSTTDPATPLTPPVTGPPVIAFTTSGGEMGSISSSSPYLLPNPTVNEVYTFTVSVRNVAGVTTMTSSPVSVSALAVNTDMFASRGCLGFNVREDCAEDVSAGGFKVTLEYADVLCQTVGSLPDRERFVVSEDIVSPSGVCISVATRTETEFCYNATLMYNAIAIMSLVNRDFDTCSVSSLRSMLGPNVVIRTPDSGELMVPHSTTATLNCESDILRFNGNSRVTCVDGEWNLSTASCTMIMATTSMIIAIVLLVVVVFVMITVIVVVVAIIFIKKPQRKGSESTKDTEKHKSAKSSSPPPPDSLYVDPNTIVHQTAATSEEYAMVERKTKEKPAQQGALYQDPNAIEHETPPSGEMYAVADKPKRESSKKKEPDVVPPGSTGLAYADIDVSAKHNKPKAHQPQVQDPGHVEYADISREKAQ